MVSNSSNPPGAFYTDPNDMALPGLSPFSAGASSTAVEDLDKKIRKPYTSTKSRQSWTDAEHDKFLEALQLFDRDWKKIEAFIGSKTVIQIRSHAQKYFLKVQKSGGNEHLPPPRPKRKAAHPYPHKAAKNAPHLPLMMDPVNSSASVSLPKPGYLNNNEPDASQGDLKPVAETAAVNPCSSAESTPRVQTYREMPVQTSKSQAIRVLPDFAQVYSFIGSVFDPNVTGHLQNLKQMDPIDVETALLLMRNLSINLTSPDFENHRKVLSTYESDPKDPAYDAVGV